MTLGGARFGIQLRLDTIRGVRLASASTLYYFYILNLKVSGNY